MAIEAWERDGVPPAIISRLVSLSRYQLIDPVMTDSRLKGILFTPDQKDLEAIEAELGRKVAVALFVY